MIITAIAAAAQNNWLPKYTNTLSNINGWNLGWVFLISLVILLIGAWLSIELHNKYLTRKYKNDRSIDIGKAGISYYPNRDALPMLRSQVDHAHTLFCLWHGTAHAQADGLYRTNKIKKLLLIAPEKNYEAAYKAYIKRSFAGVDADAWAGSVIETARNHIRDRIDLKALDETPPFLMIISNPYNTNGRIQLEEFNLKIKSSDRQTFIIDKEKQPYLFATFLSYFLQLWERGKKREWEKLYEQDVPGPKTEIESIQTMDMESLPAWLRTDLVKDGKELAECLLILTRDWEFSVEDTEPYAELTLVVQNIAIFPISVIGVKGHFWINDVKCNLPAILEREEKISHRARWPIKIKQIISGETAKKIIDIRNKNEQVKVNLAECRLIVKSEQPDYSGSPVEISIGLEYYRNLIKI